IEQEASVAGGNGSQPKVAGDPVSLAAGVVDEPNDQVVEDRRVRTPGRHLGETQPTATGRATPTTDLLFTEACGKLNDGTGRRYGYVEFEAPLVQPRPQPDGRDMALRKRLQPDRLPDPGGRGVEDALRPLSPALFATRHRAVGCPIVGAHDNLVVTRTDRSPDVSAARP